MQLNVKICLALVGVTGRATLSLGEVGKCLHCSIKSTRMWLQINSVLICPLLEGCRGDTSVCRVEGSWM